MRPHAAKVLLLSVLLLSSTAFASISVTGGGTLSFVTIPTYGTCIAGKPFYNVIVSKEFTDFSYTDASGNVTNFPGASAVASDRGLCLDDYPGSVTLTSSTVTISFVGYMNGVETASLASLTGFLSPKYKIVGIDYTVPGEQSYVQYTGTTMMGTSTSTSSSFSTNVSSSTEICGGAGIGGNGTSICGTYSNSFTQESDTSSSFAVSQSTSYTNKWFPITGPALDHGNDVIYVWVNPQVWYTIYLTGSSGPTPVYWNGYSYDEADDSNNMEVIPIRLSQLLNPSTIPAGTQGRLLRAWASNNTDGSGPAITNQDLLNIAAVDPFSNPNYTVTIGPDGQTTTDGRFTKNPAPPMFYVAGGNYLYNWLYTTTATAGKGGKDTYSEGFAIEVKNSANWIAHISLDFKNSATFTWVDQWNTLMTQMMSQSNTVSITGPTGSYSGPDEFNVFQDNIYGTFMVAPVPPE